MDKEIITAELLDWAAKNGVEVLYAAEAGSRAWGFPSKDSDYDVRFIYRHPVEWYLNPLPLKKQDTLENIDPPLDFSGWDLQKACQLLYKGNPPLSEWLRSPEIYVETPASDRIRQDMGVLFDPLASHYHYWHMAHGNWKTYLDPEKGDEAVTRKKYLYVIRPLLAVVWLRYHVLPPPVSFDALRRDAKRGSVALLPGDVDVEIEKLVCAKMLGGEMGAGPRNHILDAYIKRLLNDYELAPEQFRLRQRIRQDVINKLFRDIVEVGVK